MESDSINKTDRFLGDNGYSLDVEIGEAMSRFLALHPPGQSPGKGDWLMLRETLNKFYANLGQQFPIHPEVIEKDFSMKTSVGTEVALRWYSPPGKAVSGSAIVYLHGGGRVSGSLELYDGIVSRFAYQSGVPFLSVDYHLSPEVQGEAQAEEAFGALTWLKKQAVDLGIDEHRIAIMGDSAGGGIAAAVAILARDRKVQLSHQILIYPMLDDRVIVADKLLLPYAVWTYDNNYTGWSASLGEDHVEGDITAIAAPGRLLDFYGLAPAFIAVGDLDVFRNENLAYAGNLAKAGVPIEFHLYPGAPHGFEFIAPDATVSKRAMADYIRVIRSI